MRTDVHVRAFECFSVGTCQICERRGSRGVFLGGTLPGKFRVYLCWDCARELRDDLVTMLGEAVSPGDPASTTLSIAVEELRARVEATKRTQPGDSTR